MSNNESLKVTRRSKLVDLINDTASQLFEKMHFFMSTFVLRHKIKEQVYKKAVLIGVK